ncbi:MAG: hypothetical protein ACI4MS_06145 [Candidatus Coproplasma sp.]
MSKGYKKSRLTSIIAGLLFLLLLLGGVFAVIRFTDLGNYLDSDFCVTYDGKVYTGENGVLELPTSGEARFELKTSEKCTLEVLPNVVDNDLSYTVNGVSHKLSERALTSVILPRANVYADYFIIDCSQDLSLPAVLMRLWNGKEIEVENCINYPYLLVITSESGEKISLAMVQPLSISENHIII